MLGAGIIAYEHCAKRKESVEVIERQTSFEQPKAFGSQEVRHQVSFHRRIVGEEDDFEIGPREQQRGEFGVIWPTAESEAGAVVEKGKPIVFRQSVRRQHFPVEVGPPYDFGTALEYRPQPLDKAKNPRRGRHTLLVV